MPVPYNSMLTIDINCDLGEGFSNDAALMPFICSANIACGFHAGDITTMQKTIALCFEHGVAIGAHPGFNDKANFGRKNILLTDAQLYNLIAKQVELLQNICAKEGVVLHHVKPHGALYNMAASNTTMSAIIAKAIKAINSSLIVYGLSNSYLISEPQAVGLLTAAEVFADRTYQSNGILTPRSEPNAMLTNTADALKQVVQMVQHQTVTATNGSTIPIKAQTICIHGDGEHALDFAKAINKSMKENNIQLKPFGY